VPAAQIRDQSLATAFAKPVVQTLDVAVAARMLVATPIVEKRSQIGVPGLGDTGPRHPRAGVVRSPQVRPRFGDIFSVETIHQAADPTVGMPYAHQPAVVLKIRVLQRIDGARL